MTIFILLLATIIILIDQTIKFFVSLNLNPSQNLPIIPGLLKITYVENYGIAFGLLANKRILFIIFTFFLIVFLLVIWKKFFIRARLFSLAVALILGGGVSNLIDRIFRGFVIDYIELSFFPPICNFADYCVSAGTVLLIIYLIFFHEKFFKEEKR